MLNKKNVKYYIESAGGIKSNGDKSNITLIYPNGEVKPVRRYLFAPLIIDGSTLVVNEKVKEDMFDINSFANTILSYTSSIITILVLSRQL